MFSCNVPKLFHVSLKVFGASRFPTKFPCSQRNFVVLPKQALLELSPSVRTDAKKTDKNLKDPSQP